MILSAVSAISPAQTQAPSLLGFGGPLAVGVSSAPQAAVVTIQQGGVLGSVRVTTQGVSGLDFVALPGGTCAIGQTYTAGQTCTVNIQFTPAYPGDRRGAITLRAADGTALATQFLSGTGVGAQMTFLPGVTSTVAGNLQWIYAGDGIAAVNAPIFLPFGVAVDAAENLYITDTDNNRIRKVTAATGIITTVAGTGVIGGTGDGGPAVQATVSTPSFIILDGAGNLIFSDTGNNVIRKIDAATGIINTIAGTMGQHGYTGDGFAASTATLNSPNGLSLDTEGNLYIADTGNNAIRRVDVATGIITTIAGNGTAWFSGDGGLATAAQFNAPWGVTVSSSHQIYIADQNNNRIRMIDATGIITTVAGSSARASSGDSGPATAAGLAFPAGVAIDTAGNLYIADSGTNAIRKVSATTGIITSVVGGFTGSITGDTSPANATTLYGPYTVTLDGAGNLFFSDVFHNRIRKLTNNQGILEYDPIRVGRVSPAKTQTIENDGNAPLTMGATKAVTNSVFDPATTTCASSTPLAPLDTCMIGAQFAPTSIGDVVYGSLSVSSNSANAPGTLTVAGQVLSIDPTTLSLTSSLNPSNVGVAVTFSMTATSAGTIPTGTVTLLDGATTIGSAQLKTGGIASIVVSNLTVGSHVITASYAGDSSNAASVSAPITQVIKDTTAPTTTTLIANSGTIAAGATLRLTATVSIPALDSSNGTPGGTITFTEGSTVLGTAVLSGGIANFSLSTLPIGQHSIVASFPASTGFTASVSTPLAVTVQLATSTATLSSSANPSIAGNALILTATLSSNGATPTGNVSFLDGTTLLGKSAVNAQGIASLTLSGATLAVGSHSLVVSYAGDASNGASSSTPLVETVSLATTSTVLSSSLNPAAQGGTVTFTAKVSGNGGAPTGIVQFFDGSASLGSSAVNAGGIATLTLSTLTVGSHVITASYGGDSFDGVSSSVSLPQVVNQATSTVALTANANPSVFNTAITFTIGVQGTGSAPTGNVVLQDGGAAIATLPLNSNGIATFTSSTLAIGSHTLLAVYSGDTYHPSVNSASLTERVIQSTTTSVSSTSLQPIAGLSVKWTAVVSGGSGKPVTGTVNFTDGATVVAAVPVDGTGTASLTTSTLSVGSHTVAASYLGDTLSQTSASAPMIVGVQSATTTTSLTTTANPSFTGTPLTLNATVTGNGGTPTGSITFRDGSTVLSVAPVSATGAASLTLSTLTAGVHNLTASYGGDANDSGSTSAAVSQKIQQQTLVTLASSANPSLLTDNVSFTVVVSNGVPTAPTGAVTLTDGGVTVGSANLSGSGTATFTLNAPSLGSHTLVVTYAGDSQNLPASSPVLAQIVTLRPTTNTFDTSTTALSAGQTVTFVSVVQGNGPRYPTGTVSFVSGSMLLGTATLNATGVATLTVEPSSFSGPVVATYPGDSLYAASTSAGTAITVGPTTEFTFAMTPSTMTLQSGQHGSLNITVNTASTFTDTLALGCAGLPAYATCTFSSNQIAVSGGKGAALSVIVDTGNPLGSGAQAELHSTSGNAGVFACLIPGSALFGLLLWRSRKQGKRLGALLMLLILCGVASLSGCGSSFQSQTTPAGTYTFRIIGTGNATGAVQSGLVTLTVTK